MIYFNDLYMYRMGRDSGDDRGLIPRICSALFEEIQQKSIEPGNAYNVEVSYMEI
jgi:hypothetical protein